MLTYDTRPQALRREPHGDLLRQAYLLTGDPDRARQLADGAARAAGAAGADAYRLDPADTLERAKEELVRAYVADADRRSRPVPAGRPAAHPDVAVWRAICQLSPRRRAAIVLRYDEGLSEEHAAVRLNTTARLLRSDVDAALLTLRTAVPGVPDPWTRVADALAAAGRGWSDYTQPASARVAEVLSAPAQTPAPRPATRPAHGATAVPRFRSGRSVGLAAGVVAAVLLAAAVIVPRLGGGDDRAPAASGPSPSASPAEGSVRGGPRPEVPRIDVPEGMLDWPARGALVGDAALVPAAINAWKAGVPAAEAPASAVSVLWAGTLDRRTVVVVQGLDNAGRPHLAQVAGATDTAMRLQHAEPLHDGTQVLTLLPPAASGPVRVLVSPEAQVADGLLASNPMDGKPLQHTVLGQDGVSGVLPSPPGVPTCSRVVLLGLESDSATGGANVLFSGIMSADMLGGMPGDVEVGNSTLASARDATPDTPWFGDGAKLAPKVPGKGTLTVAALGPRLAAQPLDSADRRMVASRAYELRRGNGRWVGYVVDVGGKNVCASVLPVATPNGPMAWALRCPIPGKMMPGIVQVVAVAGADTVDVSLQPTKSPAGQEKFATTASRPDDQPADQAFATLEVAPMGFPCGVGALQVHSGRTVSDIAVPVYIP